MTLNVDIAWFVCSISAMTTMTIATDAAAATTIIKIKITADAKKRLHTYSIPTHFYRATTLQVRAFARHSVS